MSKFYLHYIPPTGGRVEEITEPFDTLDQAESEATLILEEFVGSGSIGSPMGFIEVCRENGVRVSVVQFPGIDSECDELLQAACVIQGRSSS